MIDEWLLGVEELIVRTPGGLARWSEPTPEQAKVNRVHFELFETADDLAKLRPYFVVQENQLAFERELESQDVLQPDGSVEVLYTETLSNPNDRKASKVGFVKFVGDMVKSIGERQGKPIAGDTQTSYLPIQRIHFSQLPTTGKLAHEDIDVPGTLYFWCSFILAIG